MLFHTAAISQVGVLGIVKPSGADPCDGKINLEFVESELPDVIDEDNIPKNHDIFSFDAPSALRNTLRE